MEKKRFTVMPRHKNTRYYISTTLSKLAHVEPKGSDTSPWWYVWDMDGNYKGCTTTMPRKGSLSEITKEEFLKR